MTFLTFNFASRRHFVQRDSTNEILLYVWLSGIFGAILDWNQINCKNNDHTCLFQCINNCRVCRKTSEHSASCSNNFLGTRQMLMKENNNNNKKTCIIPIWYIKLSKISLRLSYWPLLFWHSCPMLHAYLSDLWPQHRFRPSFFIVSYWKEYKCFLTMIFMVRHKRDNVERNGI